MEGKAELEALKWIIEFRKALKTETYDDDDYSAAMFRAKILKVEDEDRRDELKRMFEELIDASSDDALERFTLALQGSGGIIDAFEMGRRVAENGEADLFFPAAAAQLEVIAANLSALKESADEVIGSVEDLREAFEAEDLESVIETAKSAKEDVEALVAKLGVLREGLQGD